MKKNKRKTNDILNDIASKEISLCHGCYCMTRTIDKKCAKCGAKKLK